MTNNSPSLGSLLSLTLNELEQAKIKGLAEQANADLEKIRKERDKLTVFVNKIIDKITESVTAGKVPMIKVTDYDGYTWLKTARNSAVKAAHQDIWDSVVSWGKDNDLSITVTDDWDSCGTNSWVNVSALPFEKRGNTLFNQIDLSNKTNVYGNMLFKSTRGK